MFNGMKFNKFKCIPNLGWSNAGHEYKLGEEWLETSSVKRDLRMLVNNRLNMGHQCALAARRENCNLGCVRHSVNG